ncbi:MAG: hypothetical protein ACKO7P_02795 [Bacteroidota bacterium]
MKNLKRLILTAVIGAFLINSCSIERRYHRTGFNVNWNNTSVKMKKDRNFIQSETEVNSETFADENSVKKTYERSVLNYSDINDNSIAQNSDALILNQENENPQSVFVLTSNNEQKPSINSHNPVSKSEIEKSTESNSNIKNRVVK